MTLDVIKLEIRRNADTQAIECCSKEDLSKGREHAYAGISLGLFDGLHIGHRELLTDLVFRCSLADLSPEVYTFDLLPKLKNKKDCILIQSQETKFYGFKSIGIKRVVLQAFNDCFSHLTGPEFLEKVLYDALKVRLIVVGYDFRYGKDLAWDVKDMQAWGAEKGVEVHVKGPVQYGQDVVHSKLIREELVNGNMEKVSNLLGSDYEIEGTVIHGNAIGRTLGYPTANVVPSAKQILPPYGVYISSTKVGDVWYPSVTSLGTRPTVHQAGKRVLLETYLINEDIDLYDQVIYVKFHHFIRREVKFDNFDALISQIKADEQDAKLWFAQDKTLEQIDKDNKIHYHALKFNQFNSAYLKIRFVLPRSEQSAALDILAACMTKTGLDYPTPRLLSRALDEAYGSHLDHQARQVGDIHIIDFFIKGLTQAPDKSSPFADTIRILLSLLKHPNLDEPTFLNTKNNWIDRLKYRLTNKEIYAYDQFMDHIYQDSPYESVINKRIEAIQQTDLNAVKQAYTKLWKDSQIDVYFAGKLEQSWIQAVKTGLSDIKRSETPFEVMPYATPKPFLPSVKSSREEIYPVEQSKLHMGFNTHVMRTSIDFIRLGFLNVLFGGDSHSLLFETVREELGLAYTIHSGINPYTSTLVVSAGICPGQEEEAKKAIFDSLEALKAGDFSDRQFESTKQMIRTGLKSIPDHLGRCLDYQIYNQNMGITFTLENQLKIHEDMTKEDVMRLAKQIEFCTDYVLKRG